jgi:hypothetical protein
MNREEVIALMVESLHKDNRDICKQIGMSEAEIEESISKSSQAINYMMYNIYNVLIEKKVIK